MNKNKARALLGEAQLEDARRLLDKKEYVGRTLDALVSIVKECHPLPVFSALSPGDVAWAKKVLEVQKKSSKHQNSHIRCLKKVWSILQKKHPELYVLPTCEVGWYDLIDSTLTKVEDLFEGKSGLNGLKTFQIKEKFGALRIYVWRDADICGTEETTDEDALVQIILNDAEKTSLTVCELCGEVGELRKEERSWQRTLCVFCDEEVTK